MTTITLYWKNDTRPLKIKMVGSKFSIEKHHFDEVEKIEVVENEKES